ncbi:MAG: CHAD domain-containing protein [Chloroflexota bacterium]|nr:CHAD domain-containing protein [Chloroflexota bacterium]
MTAAGQRRPRARDTEATTPSAKRARRAKGKNDRQGVALNPDQPYRAALIELIAERWTMVWQAVPTALVGDDIEGVHDVRVASRRLRAAMDVAVPCFPDDWYRRLHQAAKSITKSLGEVRDRDVLLASLTKERAASTRLERPGLDRIIQRIEAERRQSRGEMEAYLSQLLESDLPAESRRRFGRIPPDADPVATNDGSGLDPRTSLDAAR